MKKKLSKVALAAVVVVCTTAPVSAVSICDVQAGTFEVWLAQQLFC